MLGNGYKDTDIGQFPEEWGVAPLGQKYNIQQGKALSRGTHHGRSGKFPFLRTSNVYWGRLDLLKLDEMEFSGSERERLQLRRGDLLICEGGDIGRTAIWNAEMEDCYYQNHLFRVRAKEPDVEPAFHMYWMQVAMNQLGLYQSAGNRTTIPNLSQSRLSAFLIPLPPLPEQRRIAAVLNTIQDAIAAQEDVIAAAKTFKRSLMQRLFTYGPGREPADTKETAIGEIPARWEVTTIAALLKEPIKNGAFIRREQFGNGLPFLNVADVYKSAVANLSLVERVAGSEADQATYGLQMGDLIFVRSSLKEEGVGHCCIVGLISEPSIYDCHLMRVRLNSDSALSSFVGYFFLTPLGKQSLIARSKKTTMTTINQDGLAGALLPLPPYEEQAQIADSIWAVDEKIAAEEDRLTALDVLFKSMLHLLMTGQIRLLSDAGLLPE